MKRVRVAASHVGSMTPFMGDASMEEVEEEADPQRQDEGGFVSLHEAFDILAEQHKDSPAVEDASCDGATGDRASWTYTELRGASLLVAERLVEQFAKLADAGLQETGVSSPTETVSPSSLQPLAMLMRRSPRWVAVHLAAMRLGLPSLALSADLKSQDELHRNREAILEHRPCILVVDASLRLQALELLGGAEMCTGGGSEVTKIVIAEDLCSSEDVCSISMFQPSPAQLPPPWPQRERAERCADDALYLVYTGGTTSASKCVVVTHRMALHELRAYPGMAPLQSSDRVLHQTSAYWGATSLGIFDLAWACGACLVMSESGAGPAEVASAVDTLNVTVAGIVPSVLEALGEDQCQSLRVVFTWGEALLPSTATRWSNRCALLDLLIASEYWLILFADYRQQEDGSQQGASMRRPGFRPVRGARLTLLPPAREEEGPSESSLTGEVASGEVGELYMAGPMVSSVGYSKPALNSGAFVDLPVGDKGKLVRHFRTRDLARRREDGSYEYCGRADGFAKVGGKWLDLASVEQGLRAGGCKDASLVWDETAKRRYAAIVLEQSAARPQLALATRIARIQRLLPRDTELHVLRDLPRHPTTNKVHRGAIVRQLAACAEPHHRPVPAPLLRVRRSLHCGFLLAAAAGARGAEILTTGIRLAPGLTSWKPNSGLLHGVHRGLSDQVLSWASWHRAIGKFLNSRGSLAALPYIAVLLMDASLTGLSVFQEMVGGPIGIIGVALLICKKAPAWLRALLHLAGACHAARHRGGLGWLWAFWGGLPWLGDHWCSEHWGTTAESLGSSFKTYRTLLQEAGGSKGFGAILNMKRCQHCMEWAAEGETWKESWYCERCTTAWNGYQRWRRELGLPSGSPAGTPVSSPAASPRATDGEAAPVRGQGHTQGQGQSQGGAPGRGCAKKPWSSKRWRPALDQVDFSAAEVAEADSRTPKRVCGLAVGRTSAAPAAAKASASPLAVLVEKCTGLNVSEVPESLGGLESLKVIALVSSLRREMGIELPANAVAGCGSLEELDRLCAQARAGGGTMVALEPQQQEAGLPTASMEEQLRSSWKIYAIPRFWKAPVGWLIRLHDVPDEDAMRAACRALVRRHIGLRVEPRGVAHNEAVCQLVNNTAPVAVALRQLLGDVGTGVVDGLCQGLFDAWPHVGSIPMAAAEAAKSAGASAEEVEQLAGQEVAHFRWMRFDSEADLRMEAWQRARSRGFKLPANIGVLVLSESGRRASQEADRGAGGVEQPQGDLAYLSIAVNHAVCDGATIVALYADLMALHRAALACQSREGRPVMELDPEEVLAAASLPHLPNGMVVQQQRLQRGLRGDGQDAIDFAHGVYTPRRGGYDHYVRLLAGASRVLEAGAVALGVPADHLLIAGLAVAYGRVAEQHDEVKISLIVPNRDAVSEGHMVGNMATTRHLRLWVAGRSLLHLALDLSQKLRRREWGLCDVLGDDGNCVFVNLRAHPRFDGASPEMEKIDTYRANTRSCRNAVEMFADQETADQWTLSMGLRDDIDGTSFAEALKRALWCFATDPLSLAVSPAVM